MVTKKDGNTEIIDHNNNWAHLQYLDAYYIKTMSHENNIGLKARSSRPEVFCEKGVLGHLFFKKETLAQVFSCEFYEISKNIFSYRTPPVAASGKRQKNYSDDSHDCATF